MKTNVLAIGLLILTGLAPGRLFAQELQTGAAQRTIEGQAVPGWATALPLNRRRVEKAWAERLRRWGKVKSSKSVYLVESALIPAISLNPVRVASLTEKTADGVVVFLAVADADGYLTAQDANAEMLVDFLEDFARQAFRDEKARDVAEAAKQLRQAEGAQAQLRSAQARLEDKQQRNAEQHVQLTQTLTTLQADEPERVAAADTARVAFEALVADTVLSKKEQARLRQPLDAAQKALQQHQRQQARTAQQLRRNEQQRQRLVTALAENARQQVAAREATETARQHLEAERARLAELQKL